MSSDSDIEQPVTDTDRSAGQPISSSSAGTAPSVPDGGMSSWRLPVRPSRFTVAVVIASAWAVVANFARLGTSRVAFDEPIYSLAGWRYVHGDHHRPPTTTFPSNFDNFEHAPLAKYLFGLAQLVAGHPSVTADRFVAAMCTLGTAVVLGVWLGRVAGRWIGLGAATLVAVLPMSAQGLPFRFGRYGFLDPVAELFAVASVALSWVWFRRDGRAAWAFAVATGVCVGLATASKENGFLGAVGPVVVGLVVSARRWQTAVERLLQAVAALAASCIVFVISYVGLGHPSDDIRFMLRYQREHANLGHLVEFAGRVAVHPPWWAFLWFVQHGIGAVVCLVCVVCVVAALALRRDRLVSWCVAALAGPLIFHMAIARVVLSFYWVMWMPAFLALVALGVAELARLASSRRKSARIAGPAVAMLCAAVLALASAHDTYQMLTRPVAHQPTYAAAILARAPLTYLRLDERAGATTAADSSGSGHPASYTGGPRLGAKGLLTGDTDKAVGFNGSSQYATIAGSSWMDVPDYTVAVWFSGAKARQYLLARDNFLAKVWNLQLDESGHLRFVTYASFGGGAQPVDSSAAYNDGLRHMAVCVKLGASMLLYVDGDLAGSASWKTYARSPTVGIDLARRGNNHGLFAGTLDEFAFYGAAFSAADVLALYRAGTPTGPASR